MRDLVGVYLCFPPSLQMKYILELLDMYLHAFYLHVFLVFLVCGCVFVSRCARPDKQTQ